MLSLIFSLVLPIIWPEELLYVSHASKQLLHMSMLPKIDLVNYLLHGIRHLRRQHPESLTLSSQFINMDLGIVHYPRWIMSFGPRTGQRLRSYRIYILQSAQTRMLLNVVFQFLRVAVIRAHNISSRVVFRAPLRDP